MAIGPHPTAEAEGRSCFTVLRKRREDYAQHFSLPGLTDLTMGVNGAFIGE